MGVIELDINIDPEEISNSKSHVHSDDKNGGRSKFQGGMAMFATTNNDNNLSDYDNGVDWLIMIVDSTWLVCFCSINIHLLGRAEFDKHKSIELFAMLNVNCTNL